MNEFQKAQSERILGCYGESSETLLEKGGEGARGGKVIGHTKSGKPVYANLKADHENYKHFTSTDHKEAASLHNDAKQFLHPRENAGEMDKHRSASESHIETSHRPYKNHSKEELHKLADKKAGRDRADAVDELANRYRESHPGQTANTSALDRSDPKTH